MIFKKHREKLSKIKKDRENRSTSRFIDEPAIVEVYERIKEKFPVTIEEVRSESRKRNISTARTIIMWVSYYIHDHSQEQLGDFFGNRCQTSVSTAINNLENWYDTEPKFREFFDELIFIQYGQQKVNQ
jgi:chromosomal replication initiation ATPase DnaA